ncbi:hypothetical protein NEOLI_001745 [Neolecta irregularis DAH-3]|uniref:F-box domain-containing protein n=1 Tax=Neolecta irregularis (strain DAH-3) TaxID=1198029 RepID=A0A1U7LVT5_NEOID|nr:hypothetical protein NEOLI_001745 [Neolecta irregularis DAH-3]|eukprot:OLL26777.1 hypothetical protein NEOLI_001745 [Neolecta irregularis DAH-3]
MSRPDVFSKIPTELLTQILRYTDIRSIVNVYRVSRLLSLTVLSCYDSLLNKRFFLEVDQSPCLRLVSDVFRPKAKTISMAYIAFLYSVLDMTSQIAAALQSQDQSFLTYLDVLADEIENGPTAHIIRNGCIVMSSTFLRRLVEISKPCVVRQELQNRRFCWENRIYLNLRDRYITPEIFKRIDMTLRPHGAALPALPHRKRSMIPASPYVYFLLHERLCLSAIAGILSAKGEDDIVERAAEIWEAILREDYCSSGAMLETPLPSTGRDGGALGCL